MDEKTQKILLQRQEAATREGPERLRLLELMRSLAYEDELQNYKLSSGKPSTFYINCLQVSSNPEALHLIGSEIIRMLARDNAIPLGICGVVLGGVPIAISASMCRNSHRFQAYQAAASQTARDVVDTVLPVMPSLLVRSSLKDHGPINAVEGVANVAQNSVVAVVDDVVSSGSSMLDAIRAVESVGYKVIWTGCLVDRSTGGRELLKSEGYHLHSLFTIDEVKPSITHG